jgi:hypothetical protein
MDVGGWLRGLGLEQYAAAFHGNAIDDAILPSLTADDLKDLTATRKRHNNLPLQQRTRHLKTLPSAAKSR